MNANLIKAGIWIFIYTCLPLTVCCQQQARVDFYQAPPPSFVNVGENIIQNSPQLKPFFEKLFQERTQKNKIINIVHIGDSHLQADLMTAIVRQNFHRHFGNAGRGLVVPCKVAGSNEPLNFSTWSNVKWEAKRCVFPEKPLPVGVGGITIKTTDPTAYIALKTCDAAADLQYGFDDITLFIDKPNSFAFDIKTNDGQTLATLDKNQNAFDNHTLKTYLPTKIHEIKLQVKKNDESETHATIYGMVLGNSHDGIMYHTIGVNGAQYDHYDRARYFVEQLPSLNPDLIIISLGTNEAQTADYNETIFRMEVMRLIAKIKQKNAGVPIILTSPADSYRKKIQSNPQLFSVRNVIVQQAQANGLAYWDLYQIGGGQNSADQWKAHNLLRPDGLHYTQPGYELQGNLFFHALMNAYNQYVELRPE